MAIAQRWKREFLERRLEELDVILEELAKHRGVDPDAYARDLCFSHRAS